MIFCFLAGLASGQVSEEEKTLLRLGDRDISVGAFKYLYEKNHRDSANIYTKKSLSDYLELFVAFKRKVLEAERQNLGQSESFKAEFAAYKRQLAKPYLTTNTETLVEEAYQRLQEEVRASHILLQLAPEADSAQVYAKILNLRQKILSGADFDSLAHLFSEDPSAKINRGDLGYFTALQMVYAFESAAYKTPVGKVSEPLRSRFGYHLLKVIARRPNRGSVKVAHIMLKNENYANDSLGILEKIQNIHKKIEQDTSLWNALCRTHSEDPTSSRNKGELDWFSVGEMPPSFGEAAFALNNKGDISPPLQTAFGWHIIKLLDKKPLPPLSEIQTTLRQKIRQDSRVSLGYAIFIEQLKSVHNYKEYPENIEKTYPLFDSTLLQGNWHYDTGKKREKPLFRVGENTYTQDSFLVFAKAHQQENFKAKTYRAYAEGLFKLFAEQKLIASETEILPQKHPEYRYLLQEYREGMLFFEVMQKEIWQPSASDSLALNKFFEKNQKKYYWGNRLKAKILAGKTEDLRNEIKEKIAKLPYPAPVQSTEFVFEADTNTQQFTHNTKQKLWEAIRTLRAAPQYSLKLTFSETLALHKNALKNFFSQNNISEEKIILKEENINDDLLVLRYFSSDLKDLEAYFQQKYGVQNVIVSEGNFEIEKYGVLQKIPQKKGVFEVKHEGMYYTIEVESTEKPRPKTRAESKAALINDYQLFLEKEWLKKLETKFPLQLNKQVFNGMIAP